jgi:predicted enzyme related to lactoylglutathione lyase
VTRAAAIALPGRARRPSVTQVTSRIFALCLDANDPAGLARFWSGVLGWQTADDSPDGTDLIPNDDTGFRLRFLATEDPKVGQNQMHFDLTSTSPEGQQETVARALALGGRHLDVGQTPEEGHVVLADPEGNELCVIEPGNGFLADCGFVGAVSSDGSQEVGYFWSEALGWPLVWDQDQETAIRAPYGGPKVTWGGPPVMAKSGRNRLHFDVVPPDGSDLQTEADRLVALGATRVGDSVDVAGGLAMTDPDGNEFCLMAPLGG